MSALETIGASAIYILGTVVAAYLGAGIAAFLTRNRGFEGLIFVVLTWIAILGVGAVAGLVLLGRTLA